MAGINRGKNQRVARRQAGSGRVVGDLLDRVNLPVLWGRRMRKKTCQGPKETIFQLKTVKTS